MHTSWSRAFAAIAFGVGAVAFGSTGCARPAAATSSVGGGMSTALTGVSVEVVNHNFLDVDVFAVEPGGRALRLGTVTGNSSGTFTLAPHAIATGAVRLVAAPIGSPGAAGSGPLLVSGGQTITFTIEQSLAQSSATVH